MAESWDHKIVFDSLNREFTVKYSKFYKEPTLSLSDDTIYLPANINKNHSDIYICKPNYIATKKIEDDDDENGETASELKD